EIVDAKRADATEAYRIGEDARRLLGPFETSYDVLSPEQREELTQQHRMHPQICQVVSNTFYDRKLKDDPETAGCLSFLYGPDHPFLADRAVLWLDIPHLRWPSNQDCTDEREVGGSSFSNRAEISVARHLLQHLETNRP